MTKGKSVGLQTVIFVDTVHRLGLRVTWGREVWQHDMAQHLSESYELTDSW